MTRIWPALVASVVAVGVLLALIYAARPLGSSVYEQHHQILNAITATADSYASLRAESTVDGLDVAKFAGTIATLRARLEQGARLVAEKVPAAAIADPLYQRYTTTLSALTDTAAQADSQLQGLHRALNTLREDGPAAVQHLRQTRDSAAADRFYSLWLTIYEHGLGGATDSASLVTQLASFEADDSTLSAIKNAMYDVLSSREPLVATLDAIQQAPFGQAAAELAAQYRAQHAARVDARNDARVLVSLYSVLLFAGLGIVVYRLHRSYRELNATHDELRRINAELEDRVDARTRDVQKAYDNLKQSQVQLVQAEKMSSLGQLVAGISHEINTPLLYLHSNTSLNREALLRIQRFLNQCYETLSPRRRPGEPAEDARKRVVEELKQLRAALVGGEVREELREVVALIDDNLEGIDELTQLAQSLKDFSRLDHAPVDQFNVNDGVRRTLVIVKNMLKRHVVVTTDLGELPSIYCAPSQINQVLLNLITNASQAIEGNGEIAISTAVENNFVVVRVRDNGSGISPQIMHRIRDPFFTTKEVGSGTGLGLSIVEEIISQHNGRLAIDSTVGQGSTFSVYLPVDRTAAQARKVSGGGAAAVAMATATAVVATDATDANAGNEADAANAGLPALTRSDVVSDADAINATGSGAADHDKAIADQTVIQSQPPTYKTDNNGLDADSAEAADNSVDGIVARAGTDQRALTGGGENTGPDVGDADVSADSGTGTVDDAATDRQVGDASTPVRDPGAAEPVADLDGVADRDGTSRQAPIASVENTVDDTGAAEPDADIGEPGAADKTDAYIGDPDSVAKADAVISEPGTVDQTNTGISEPGLVAQIDADISDPDAVAAAETDEDTGAAPTLDADSNLARVSEK